MDKLEKIFELQKSLNDYITNSRGLAELSTDEWLQKMTLAAMSELSEVLEETNYKWWKNDKPLDYGKLKEEIIDVLHFVVSMALKVGMSAQECFDIYMHKNEENIKRQEGKSNKKGYDSNKRYF